MTTTRFLFILFLLLNILFFAASRGWLGFGSSGESGKVSIELNPERVKILGPTPPPEIAQTDDQVSSDSPPAEESEQSVCLSWSGLTAAQNTKLIALFSAAGIQAAVRDVQVVSSWRVRVPPLPTREAAEILVENMDESGMDKSSVKIEEAGGDKFAIVLGESFRTRQAAERHLETAKANGFVNAAVEPRNTSERRVEATVGVKRAETLLNGQPFARRHKLCTP
jgi:hypothetical protein